MRSRSCTSSAYARLARPTRSPLLGRLDERPQRVGERLLRRADDRDLDAERLLGLPHRLVVQERDDRLAERHRLDREDAVPAGVQLVDDHVGAAGSARTLRDGRALRRSRARRRAPRRPRRRAPCPCARATTARAARRAARDRDGGAGSIARTSIPGGITCASGTQRAASYEPTTRAPARCAHASSAGVRPRMSEPRKCMTERLPSARSSGNCTDFGSSVSPK